MGWKELVVFIRKQCCCVFVWNWCVEQGGNNKAIINQRNKLTNKQFNE